MTRSNAAPAQRVPSTAGDEAAECVQLHRINLWCSARIWRADVHFLFRVATSCVLHVVLLHSVLMYALE